MRLEIVTKRGWFKTRWFWRIKANNNEVLASSEIYSSHAMAKKTAEAVRAITSLPVVEVSE